MSDKQRADHIQAKYWQGFITRTEVQAVFDEHAKVLMAQAGVIQKLDAVISCLAEKLGVNAEEVNTWMKGKMEAAQKAAAQAPVEATQPPQEAAPTSSPIVLTD